MKEDSELIFKVCKYEIRVDYGMICLMGLCLVLLKCNYLVGFFFLV